MRQLTTRIKGIGAVICERDVTKARERDAKMLVECGGIVKDTPRQDVMPRLEEGCLSTTANRARGTLFPQPQIVSQHGKHILLDGHAGYSWRLVIDDTLADSDLAVRGAKVVHIGLDGLVETHGVVVAWMQHHECHAALVRPDHYVFGIAANRDELKQLIVDFTRQLHLSLDFEIV